MSWQPPPPPPPPRPPNNNYVSTSTAPPPPPQRLQQQQQTSGYPNQSVHQQTSHFQPPGPPLPPPPGPRPGPPRGPPASTPNRKAPAYPNTNGFGSPPPFADTAAGSVPPRQPIPQQQSQVHHSQAPPPTPPHPYNLQNMAQALPPQHQHQQPQYPQQYNHQQRQPPQQPYPRNNVSTNQYPPTQGLRGGTYPPPPGVAGRGRAPAPYPTTPAAAGGMAHHPLPPQPPNASTARSPLDPSQIPQPTLPGRPMNVHGKALPAYYPKAHMKHAMAATSSGGGGGGTTTASSKTDNPPLADTRFVVLEDGNASPHFIRSCYGAIPQDKGMLRQTTGEDMYNENYHEAVGGGSNKLSTMGFFCTPLALPSMDFVITTEDGSSSSGRLPSSGMMGLVTLEGSGTVIRCHRCQAYANAFWSSGKCNFCGASSNIGNVSSGTMEYKDLTGPFITRDTPVKPNIVYCIDIGGMMMTANNSNSSSDDGIVILDCLATIKLKILPALYRHYQSQQEQSMKKIIGPSVGIVFSLGQQGIYLLSKTTGGTIVMSDIKEDPYCPLPLTEFTFDLSLEYETFQSTYLMELTNTFVPSLIEHYVSASSKSDTFGSSGGAAMKFLVDALRVTGGRAVFITSSRPNIGVGAIPDRESALGIIKAYGASMCETWLYTPLQDALPRAKGDMGDRLASDYYKKLGEDCATSKVAMDIVVLKPSQSTSFLHMATLSKVCQVSNGRFVLIEYDNNGGRTQEANIDDWKIRFEKELTRPLVQYSGWDAVFKVRCSSGLRIQNMVCSVGTTTRPSSMTSLTDDSPEVELSTVSPDTCIAVTVDHRVGGIPKASPLAFVQTALLYTNPWTGQRRLRVSTLAIRVASSPPVAFKSIDFGCLAALWLRQATKHVSQPDPNHASSSNRPTDDAMKVLMEQVVGILAAYRKHGSGSPLGPMQFALPETLKLLPLLCMSLKKSPMFRRSLKPQTGAMVSTAIRPNPSADDRAYHLYHSSRCTPATTMYMAHPVLLDVTASPDNNNDNDTPPFLEWVEGRENGNAMDQLQHSAFVHLPPALEASISNLSDSKVYLLDTMLAYYILIGRDVPKETVQSIRQALASPGFEEDHPIGHAISQLQLFSQVGRDPRWIRPCRPPTVIVEQDDPRFQSLILKFMVCDATDQEREYGDFLSNLHRTIGTRLR